MKNGDETSGQLIIPAEDGVTEDAWGRLITTGAEYAAGIGGGHRGSAEKVYINGGSVNASSIGCQPVVSAEDATPVYLTKLTFKNGEAPVSNTAVSGLTSTYNNQPYAYGLNDAATDGNGVFYAYLPENTGDHCRNS